MVKKLIVFIAIIVITLSVAAVTYADSGYKTAKKGSPVFQLIFESEGNKTLEPQLIISGTAKEGTVITVSHYWYKIGEDESILKKNTDKSSGEAGEWISVEDPEVLTIGASGILAKTVELEKGKNKIIVAGKDKAGNEKKQTIMMELCDKSELTEYINNLLLKNIEQK